MPTSVGRVHLMERLGDGASAPLVLLHGLSSAGVHYARVLRYLGGATHVVLPDLPGHGFSDTPKVMDAASILAGVFEVLDAALHRPAVLVGNSLGGYVAIRYALARPEKVAGLMLAAPAGAAMDPVALQALRGRFSLGSHREALAFVDALFARRRRLRHLYALGLREYFSLPQTQAVLDQMQLPMMFTGEQLARLRMPILLLWGQAERILPEANFEFFKAHLPPHAKFERPAGWGHSGFLDDPKGFAQRLLRFAAELATGPTASVPRR